MPLHSRAAIAALLLLAACAGGDRPRGGQRRYRPVADLPVRIGPPYTIRGRTYVPAEDRDYIGVGMASWYGSESGRQTANGERFRPDWIGAAHRTLPLPSYVEVSSLKTGRTILVRINDRGPFVANRVIDLSRGAARQLGMERDGTIPVRVRRVFPSDAERAALRAGRPAALRPTLTESERRRLLAGPQRAAAPVPRPPAIITPAIPAPMDAAVPDAAPLSPMAGGVFVLVATFADPVEAVRVARDVGGRADLADGMARVRIGPLAEPDAQAALARVRSAGYQDARLDREPEPEPPASDMEPTR